jgi:hypothetical protein
VMKRVAMGLLALGCLVATGCGDEVEPLGSGSLSLSWEVSPRGCASADVTHVEVQLRNAKHQVYELFECEQGRAYLPRVEPGNYRLSLSGLDRSGRETFTSLAQNMTVRAEVVNTVDFVRLTAKPAQLTVEWLFDNGRVCGANSVEQVEIAIFDDLDFEVERKRASCNNGTATLEHLSAGRYFVVANGLSLNGVLYRGQVHVDLKRGDQGRVEVTLEKQ